MCNAHKHHRVYKFGLCATVCCVLVNSTVGGFGRLVIRDIIGRVQLLTASLRLAIALVTGPVVSRFPLLIIGGTLVGTVLLCEHLSQQSRWSGGRGFNLFH